MRVLIVGESAADRDACRQTALRLGLECGGEDSVAPARLRMRLTREPAARAVLVLVDGGDDGWQALRYAAAEGGVAAYAVGRAADRERAADAGATGFFDRDHLREQLLAVTSDLPKSGGSSRGRAVVVTGAQPGSGVSAAAAGLAFALAGKDGVSLTELVNGTPDLALGLADAPQHSLAELIRESERLDAGMVRAAALHHAAGVDVLAYPPETLTPEPLVPRQVEDFLVLFRTVYDWSVFDIGHGPTATNRLAAAHADLVVVVTRIDVPGIRLTRAFVKDLTSNGVKADRLLVVGNRYAQAGQMNWKKAEEALRTPVAHWLPDDPGSVNKALSAGQPVAVAAKWSRLTREFAALAKTVRARTAQPVGR